MTAARAKHRLHLCARIRLRDSKFDVALQSGVVVDPAALVQHTAVPVVGEFVQAGVGHQNGGIAEVLGQIAQRDVEDAVGIRAGRSGRVLVVVARHAEEHQSAHPGGHRLGGGGAQRVAGVLHHAGHRGDRPRLVDTVGNQHRQHQMPWLQ